MRACSRTLRLVTDDPQIFRCARWERKQVTEISGVGGVAEKGCDAENLLECPQRRTMHVGEAVRVAMSDERRYCDQCDRTIASFALVECDEQHTVLIHG